MLHACWPELDFSMLKADIGRQGNSMFSPRRRVSIVK